MNTSRLTENNPFVLMMHPEVVLRAIEKSDRLARLKRHICHPLDKPVIPRLGTAAAFDAEIDRQVDTAEDGVA